MQQQLSTLAAARLAETLTPEQAEKVVAGLKHVAATQLSRWPQYDGAMDGAVLVLLKRPVKTKLGQAFQAGDYALATRTSTENGKRFVTVYSWRNQVHTLVRAACVKFLGDATTLPAEVR